LAVLGPSRWRGPASDFDAARRTAQSRLLAGAVVAIGGAAAVGVARAAWDIRSLTSGPGGSETTAGELLFDTRWGALWLSRQLTLVVAAGSLIFLRRTLRDPRSGRGVRSGAAAATVAAAVALAVIQALGGHAAGVDSAAGVAVGSDAAHLVGAATWIGGLAALASLGRLRRAEPAGMLAREAWRAFGPLAAACVAVVVVTGLYGLAREVASLDAVLTTTYGQALLGKSALFVVMGLLGLCSSIALHPVVAARVDTVLGRLGRRRPALRHVRRLVVVETALGVAILLLAALASASPPANGPEFEWVPAAVPDTRSGPAGDVLVSLSAYPNRPGENLLRVRATSTRRQAPSDIAMVLVRIASDVGGESIETVPLAAAGDGTYEGTTMALGQAGSWRAEVVVRRAGVEDATVAFDWELPVAAPRPRLISNRPWRAQLEMVVVALLVAQATTAVLFVRRTRPRPRRTAMDKRRLPVEPVAGGARL
jgi:copper transport protein